MTDYLPKAATIEEACAWLEKKTNTPWTLKRLLESATLPWFWLDYSPEAPQEVFGNRIEGYFAPMIFSCDVNRLEIVGDNALVTMTKTHDGKLFTLTPGMSVSLSELRFQRDEIQELADHFSAAIHNDLAASKKPPEKWSRGLKLVAFECARHLSISETDLNKNSLAEAMSKDSRVTVSNNTLQYSKSDASLKRGEDELSISTLANWTTALKKVVAQNPNESR